LTTTSRYQPDLRKSKGIVAVGLVDLHGQRRLGMARIQADYRQAFLTQSVNQLNRVQFETCSFQFRSSPSGRPWKAGTMGFKLDAV
jgi:hypothetical protein